MKHFSKWNMLHTHERIAGNSFGELLFHFSKMLLTEAGKSAMMFVANDPSLVLWLEPMLTTLLYAWRAAGATEHWLSSLGVTWLNRQDLIHQKNKHKSSVQLPHSFYNKRFVKAAKIWPHSLACPHMVILLNASKSINISINSHSICQLNISLKFHFYYSIE